MDVSNNKKTISTINSVHTWVSESWKWPSNLLGAIWKSRWFSYPLPSWGAGARCSNQKRQFFDSIYWKIILFDQRGVGRSLPHASIEDNTTNDLIEDIERLRKYLSIEKWVVFVGSWGQRLLCYTGWNLVKLVHVYLAWHLCRFREWNKLFFIRNRACFSAGVKKFWSCLSDDEQNNFLVNCYNRLTKSNFSISGPVAKAWASYENACSQFIPQKNNAARASLFCRS